MSNQSFSDRLAGVMRGRYGADELGNVVLGLSVILLLVNLFVGVRALSTVALVLALYSCWRLSSTNIVARRAENRAFLKTLGPVANWIAHPVACFNELRLYKHLTCPSCGQRMRVPRGKGKMRVTCPACRKKFDTRS